MGRQALRIEPPPGATPPARGRLMTPEQVAAECFQGTVRPQWVRRNVRPKVRLGHSTCVFYELDVRAWIEAHRRAVS